MDVGLVCEKCDTFNPMTSDVCGSCGGALSLDGKKGALASLQSPVVDGGKKKAKKPKPTEDYLEEQTQVSGSGIACPECHASVQPGFKFCGGCGARVEAAAAPKKRGGERRTMFFGAMQQARAKLVLIKGDGLDGVSYTLAGEEHIAGRTEGPLLFGDDPFLSPTHANFYYKEGKLHVKDPGSANGVYIRIRAPIPTRSGNSFLVGEQLLRVEATPPEDAGLGADKNGTYYYASPRRASKLCLVQILRGGDTGLIYRATGDVVTLGREGNDINFPNDPFISGKHAEVAFRDGGLTLSDSGSKNGTFLRVDGEMALQHGDYVFMGQQLLRVEIV